MNENKKWFAVYTRPRWEKKVAETLTRKEFESYCPINKIVRRWSDRKKIVHEPLFTSYVFVRIHESELIAIKEISGVVNIVYWLKKPAVVKDSEIETIKRFLYDHTNVKIEKTPIKIKDNIRILGGPLMELEGQVLSIKNKTVKISLPSLGYMMFAEVKTSNMEVIPQNTTTSIEVEMRYPLHAAK